nr:MAG TPA: Transcriptional regulator, MarR/EmrR family, emrR, transcriptional regulator, DNA-binding [Caudoviricetes sp.]
MKLNIDCVRDVLLELETFTLGSYDSDSFIKSIEKYGNDNVTYSLAKLTEAGYINAKYSRTMDGRPHFDDLYDITFSGHEFLEKIRSDGIWNNNIKPVLSQVGSKSFDMIIQVSTSIISSLISKQLGITS